MNDLISREAAIDAAVQSIKDWDRMFIREANCRIRDAINELPSAQSEQKTGKLVNAPIDKRDITEEMVKEWCEKRCLMVITPEHYYQMVRRITSLELELTRKYHNLNNYGEKVGNWELKL